MELNLADTRKRDGGALSPEDKKERKHSICDEDIEMGGSSCSDISVSQVDDEDLDL
jgi:hypothetical protein